MSDIITDLRLTPTQIRQATSSVLHVVYRAWSRRAAGQRDRTFEEFVDRIPAWQWPLMFEACALGHLGRRCEARTLAAAGRALHEATRDDPTLAYTAPAVAA
ncbi:hypothetical protein [Streptomyces sp. NPDC049555]|uniref:hypothetical protein n=1 Tax=Streptomyces sp. NPDC049555 TaxID=3154930 RepID=UPI00342F89D9